MNNTEILEYAIETFGFENQKLKCAEECAELSKELIKDVLHGGRTRETLEEMADVEIMLSQMKIIYEDDMPLYEKIRKEKLYRLREFLNDYN